MATRATTGGGQPLPTALLAQAVPMLTRHELAALTERLIDALDVMEPDPDLEPENDYCTAGDDRGTRDRWGTQSGWDEDDETGSQPLTLNAA